MATPSGEPSTALARAAKAKRERTLEEWLFQEGFVFDFFQAVRLLERLEPKRNPVGGANPPASEIVRFHARVSLDFPPSAIYELARPTPQSPTAWSEPR